MNQKLSSSSPNSYQPPQTNTQAPNTNPYSQPTTTQTQSQPQGTQRSTLNMPQSTSNTDNTGIGNTGISGSQVGNTTTGSHYQGGWSVPTVENEVSRLTGSDSITMQQARNQGLRSAANRGLLNSSISGQAAEQAAISAAAPMAEKNVANQLAQQQFAQGVTANTQGQYMTATQDILNQALISINEIETATDVAQAEKDKMIENTIKRRDADLKFMQEYYSMMPTWSGNWVNFPTMPKAPGIG